MQRLKTIETTLVRLTRRITGAAGSSSSSSSRVPTEGSPALERSSSSTTMTTPVLRPPFTRTGVANMIFRVTADARGAKQLCLDACAAARTADDGGARLDELEEVQEQIQGLVARCEEEWREHFSPYLKVPLEAAARYANQTDAARTLFRDIEQDNTPISSQIKAVLSTMNDAAIASPATDSDRMKPEDAYQLGVQEGIERNLAYLERLKAKKASEKVSEKLDVGGSEQQLKKEQALRKWLERAHEEG